MPVSPDSTQGDNFPPILMNIGDLLSYWTNGLLRSTVHRVVFPANGIAEARYSIAYFFHPARQTALESVPSPMVRDREIASKKAPFSLEKKNYTAADHLEERLALTYGWKKAK